MDESSLLKQLANNCSNAFKQLYEKYHHNVFRVAFSLGLNQNEALELVQDVFVIVWERRALLMNVNSFEAYLIAITKNLSFKKLKKKAFEHANRIYFNAEQHSSIVQPELEIEIEEILDHSTAALNGLSPQQKEIFIMFTQENLHQKEIAEKLNISIRSVENQIYRAKKKIKEYLR
jgi:RNA polymerase sigma-70 factor (family 1)